MKLLTKDLIKRLPRIGSTSELPAESVRVPVKLFTPDSSCTWYLTEYDPSTGEAFGWADMGQGCPELGYFSIPEIESVRGRLGLPVERDKWWSADVTLRAVMDGAVR